MRDPRGFTLIELLAVMALIGVLAGIGVGFLQHRGSELDIGLAMIRDQVRVAALTARTRRLPTAVMLAPGRDGDAARVRARVLTPVGRWGFEDAYQGDPRLVPDVVGGTSEPGRFGLARRPTKGQPVMSLATGELLQTAFWLRDGFALYLDVRLDERAPMVLARLDQNLVVSLDENLFCEVKAVLRDGERAAGSVELRSAFPLQLHRWTTVGVAQDGENLMLFVDGREAGRVPMKGSLYQSEGDTFTISPADEPIAGLVDEVRLLAYELTDEQVLPAGVELKTQYSRIEFDRDGRVVEPVTFGLVYGDQRGDYRVTPGGTVE